MLLLLAAIDRPHSYNFKRFHRLCVIEQYSFSTWCYATFTIVWIRQLVQFLNRCSRALMTTISMLMDISSGSEQNASA